MFSYAFFAFPHLYRVFLDGSCFNKDLKNISMALSALEKSREWRWAVWLLEDMTRRKITPDLCLA